MQTDQPLFAPRAGVLPPRPARRRAHWLSALGLSAVAAVAVAEPGSLDAPFVRQGVAGFVVSDFKYALQASDDVQGLCPDGTSRNVAEIFAMTPAGKRRPGEGDAEYGKRVEQGGSALNKGPDGTDYCLNPEAAPRDPHFRPLLAKNATALGIDLDVGARPAACAQGEFTGPAGETGVDNQFYRLVGCSRSFMPGGQSNSFAIEMLSGSWGILLSVSGLDDLRNDDDIEVGIYASADPIQLSPVREPLAYATYAMDQDADFRAVTRGRIRDGVLTTDPVDVRFHHATNSMRLERPLLDARLQLTISDQGVLEGYLAGYTPVEALYDYQFGFRQGKDGKGELSPLRGPSANGAARVLGYTCPGIYQALHQLADGHPDPASGRCSSISTQYWLEARPAFVVDAETRSANEDLEKAVGDLEKKEALRYE